MKKNEIEISKIIKDNEGYILVYYGKDGVGMSSGAKNSLIFSRLISANEFILEQMKNKLNENLLLGINIENKSNDMKQNYMG